MGNRKKTRLQNRLYGVTLINSMAETVQNLKELSKSLKVTKTYKTLKISHEQVVKNLMRL